MNNARDGSDSDVKARILAVSCEYCDWNVATPSGRVKCDWPLKTSSGWERRYLARLSGTLIDGALLVTPTVVDAEHTVPVLAVDSHTGPATMPTVDSDNLRGAQMATDHLIALGHRRIGMLTGRPDLESAHRRARGYRQALTDAGNR